MPRSSSWGIGAARRSPGSASSSGRPIPRWSRNGSGAAFPVWSHDGIICTGETYRTVVKMTFAKGAALEDPSRLFNASLDGNTRRAIDVREGDEIDDEAFKALIRAAVALNTSSAARRPRTRASTPDKN